MEYGFSDEKNLNAEDTLSKVWFPSQNNHCTTLKLKKSFVSPCETKSKPLLSSIVLVYALILHTYWHLDLSPLHFQSSSMASDDIFPFKNWSISAVVRLLWRNKCKASSERYRSSCSSLSQRQKKCKKTDDIIVLLLLLSLFLSHDLNCCCQSY